MMSTYVDFWDELCKSILTSKEKESTPDTYELHITCALRNVLCGLT